MFLQVVRCLLFKGETRFMVHDENLTLISSSSKAAWCKNAFSFTDQYAMKSVKSSSVWDTNTHSWVCTELYRDIQEGHLGAGRSILVHSLFWKEDRWIPTLVPMSSKKPIAGRVFVSEESNMIASASPRGRERLHASWGLFLSLEFRTALWYSQMCWFECLP